MCVFLSTCTKANPIQQCRRPQIIHKTYCPKYKANYNPILFYDHIYYFLFFYIFTCKLFILPHVCFIYFTHIIYFFVIVWLYFLYLGYYLYYVFQFVQACWLCVCGSVSLIKKIKFDKMKNYIKPICLYLFFVILRLTVRLSINWHSCEGYR